MSKLFSELWKKINNPRSACPDVEIGHVRQVMADILAEYNNSNLSFEEKWILALITISPIAMLDIEFYWEDKSVDRYQIDYDELEHAIDESKRIAKETVDNLVNKEIIALLDDEYVPNGKL